MLSFETSILLFIELSSSITAIIFSIISITLPLFFIFTTLSILSIILSILTVIIFSLSSSPRTSVASRTTLAYIITIQVSLLTFIVVLFLESTSTLIILFWSHVLNYRLHFFLFGLIFLLLLF